MLLSFSGGKRPAGKEPTTKSWVQRTFFSTPAKASSPTAPRRQRFKSKHSTPVIVDHQRKKKEIKIPVAPDRLEPTIRFTKPSVEEGAEVFKFCLVGKFPGRRSSLEQIRDWAGKEWKLLGDWSITLLDQNHVFIGLDNEDDMVRVWPRSRWFVCGNLMRVFKWVPTFFTATAREPSSAAVWISPPSRCSRRSFCTSCWFGREAGGHGQGHREFVENKCGEGHSTDICKFSKKDQEKVDSMSTAINQSLSNAMLDLQAQTSPAILNSSGRKKRVTITDVVYPTTDSKGKKRLGESVEGVEEVCSKEHKSSKNGLAIGSIRKIVGDEVIGTSTMEIEHSLGTASVGLDINVSRKRRVIEREENEGVDRPQLQGELQAWNKNDKFNITSFKTKSPPSRQRFPIFFWKRKSKGFTDFSSSTSIYTPSLFASRCRRFTFAEIKRATKNFDSSHKIGEGGFGPVYRSKIDGIEVAIKKHSPFSNQGWREFETELNILSKLRHNNLVNLIGYCRDKNNMMLVYEFISRGNFKEHSYGRKERLLSWEERIGMCLGAARGLCYLHENGVIHRDLKSHNILISEDNEAKISDLGLGRQQHDSRYDHITTMVAGTFGYLDPEYFITGRKSDVYSFGVLFEALCGRPPINQGVPEEQKHLVRWALDLIGNGKVEDIIDPRLRVESECFKKYVGLASSCVSLQGYKRPTMEEVVQELESALKLVELG